MTKIMGIAQAEENLDEIISVLRTGGVILYPTDTQYGLGADATNVDAVSRVRAIKKRDAEKPISVVVPDLEALEKVGVLSEDARKIAEAHLPGALTLILPARNDAQTLSRTLSGETGTIGVRIPHAPLALSIARALDTPLTATSANISGLETGHNIESILTQLGQNANMIDIAIDGGTLSGAASTVVDADTMRILRQGALDIGK